MYRQYMYIHTYTHIYILCSQIAEKILSDQTFLNSFLFYFFFIIMNKINNVHVAIISVRVCIINTAKCQKFYTTPVMKISERIYIRFEILF